MRDAAATRRHLEKWRKLLLRSSSSSVAAVAAGATAASRDDERSSGRRGLFFWKSTDDGGVISLLIFILKRVAPKGKTITRSVTWILFILLSVLRRWMSLTLWEKNLFQRMSWCLVGVSDPQNGNPTSHLPVLNAQEYYSGIPVRVQPALHRHQLRARATLGYREKKMSPGKVCKSCTTQLYILILYMVMIIIYFQISLSRWHSFGSRSSISNASTTWGCSSADGIHTISITVVANEAKTQEEELMQQWTTNNEPRRAA